MEKGYVTDNDIVFLSDLNLIYTNKQKYGASISLDDSTATLPISSGGTGVNTLEDLVTLVLNKVKDTLDPDSTITQGIVVFDSLGNPSYISYATLQQDIVSLLMKEASDPSNTVRLLSAETVAGTNELVCKNLSLLDFLGSDPIGNESAPVYWDGSTFKVSTGIASPSRFNSVTIDNTTIQASQSGSNVTLKSGSNIILDVDGSTITINASIDGNDTEVITDEDIIKMYTNQNN